ncbi:MAG: hypothetical protein LBF68_08090, partial [Christensenellaceae bacterium]|nr:hypothetical protein [Christensenellaceae bacterium]
MESVALKLQEAKDSIDAIKTIAQIQALLNAKQEALSTLSTYIIGLNINDTYYEDEIALITGYVNDGNSLINSAESIALVESALNDAIANIDNVKTKTQIDLANHKESKLNDLDEYVDLADYINNQADVVAAINEGKSNIDKATTISEVDAAYEDAIDKIDAIDSDLTIALNNAKIAAKGQLDSYVNDILDISLYDDEGKAEITDVIIVGKEAIDAATVKQNISTAYQQAITNINSVKTISEKEADLDNYKASKKVELENYVDANEYLENSNQLQQAIMDGKQAIDLASTVSEVNQKLEFAKSAIDLIKSDLDLLKITAINAVKGAKPVDFDTAYDTYEQNEIEWIISTAEYDINNANDTSSIDNIQATAIYDIDKVKTILVKAKETAISAVNAAKPADYDTAYDADGQNAINAIILTAENDINAATDTSSIDSIKETAISDIGKVNTILAKAKETAISAVKGAKPVDYDSAYDTAGQNAINAIISTAENEINAATDTTTIDNLKTTAINAIGDVLTANYKTAAI